jgi:large subunit ribosomal protein L3
MFSRLLGTKVGMSQIFDENRNVIPVTVINVGGWIVTQIKTAEKDGYVALQLGLPRKRYRNKPFSSDWLKDKSKFFLHIYETHFNGDVSGFKLGQIISVKDHSLTDKDFVDVAGTSIGFGFQGVVKRWGFAGGPKSHGSMFSRRPGAIGSMRTQGEVIKGKKLPGRKGGKRITVKGLKVARVDEPSNFLFVRGAVPGKRETVLFISKQV